MAAPLGNLRQAAAPIAIVCTIGLTVGWWAAGADQLLFLALGFVAITLAALLKRFRIAGAALMALSLFHLPTIEVRTAVFGAATLAAPLILVSGFILLRQSGQSVKIPYWNIYLILLVVAAISIVNSWLFWDPQVGTGIARGNGHRWIVYQISGLFFLAVPFVAFAAGVLYARRERVRTIYYCVAGVLWFFGFVALWTWVRNPVNPIEAFTEGARLNVDHYWPAFLMVFALGVLFWERSRLLKLLAGGAVLTAAAALYATYALNAWLGILVAVGIMAWHRWGYRGLLTWLSGLAVIAVSFQPLIASIIVQRSLSSDVDRLLLWRSAVTIWSKSPWLGVGPGNLPSYMEAYSAFPLSLVLLGYQQAHNIFLELLAEDGLIGLTVFLVFGVLVVARLVKASTDEDRFAVQLRSTALGLIAASAGMAALGGGFVPTIGSAGWNAIPSVTLLWFLAGCGMPLPLTPRGPLPVVRSPGSRLLWRRSE